MFNSKHVRPLFGVFAHPQLRVLLLPLRAGRSGPGEKPHFALPILYLPMLSGVVEFDVGGTVDLQPAKFMKRHSLGPKTKGCVWMHNWLFFGFDIPWKKDRVLSIGSHMRAKALPRCSVSLRVARACAITRCGGINRRMAQPRYSRNVRRYCRQVSFMSGSPGCPSCSREAKPWKPAFCRA